MRPKGINSVPLVVSNALHSDKKISVISNNNIDALYDYLMFLLLDMPFQTRKGVDFYYWSIALHLHKLGYFYLPLPHFLTTVTFWPA
jgi:hypothetical protein